MIYGIDIGGTKIEFAAFDDHFQPLDRTRVTTPAEDYSCFVETVAGLIGNADKRYGGKAPVGLGLPGLRDGKGRALDHVFTERLWRTVKDENVSLQDYSSPREARAGIGAYLEFYNQRRPHQSLGYQTPAEVYGT